MGQQFAHASYLVECFWRDLDAQYLQRAGERLAECAALARRDGAPVEYVGSIVVSGDDVIFFLFDAGSAAAVRRFCDQVRSFISTALSDT